MLGREVNIRKEMGGRGRSRPQEGMGTEDFAHVVRLLELVRAHAYAPTSPHHAGTQRSITPPFFLGQTLDENYLAQLAHQPRNAHAFQHILCLHTMEAFADIAPPLTGSHVYTAEPPGLTCSNVGAHATLQLWPAERGPFKVHVAATMLGPGEAGTVHPVFA